MNRNEHTPFRVRVFRVIDRRDGSYSRWMVFEYIERGKFLPGSYASFGGHPSKRGKARRDRQDAFDVLNSLKNKARRAVDATKLVLGADSIDGAVSQGEFHRQQLSDWALHGKAPGSLSRVGGEHVGDAPQRPMMQREVHDDSDDEVLQRMVKEVWDFGRGRRLRWKRTGRTPAGRECDVLTVDGSEEILVGPNSIEGGCHPQ
jgi:hypothetical protein